MQLYCILLCILCFSSEKKISEMRYGSISVLDVSGHKILKTDFIYLYGNLLWRCLSYLRVNEAWVNDHHVPLGAYALSKEFH